MQALIVYESMFGNTRDIALAVAKGLAPGLAAEVVNVVDAPPEPGSEVHLLIVGAPTLLFGLSTARTRAAAASRAGHPFAIPAVGAREWLEAMPHAPARRDALTFDTRLRVHGLPGSAAKGAAKRLGDRGYRMLWPSRSFIVTHPNGSLGEREIERAQLWGRWIADGIEMRHARL
ncbi:MAG TPA: flavodoxin domain-containing protein [Nocardioidaceae bacterium]|nr:flavodoxin domain-containing protein [Nocardioidaceae bacterium]